MRMPTKEQVEDYIIWAEHGMPGWDRPSWAETIAKHLREWVAKYDEENKGKKSES